MEFETSNKIDVCNGTFHAFSLKQDHNPTVASPQSPPCPDTPPPQGQSNTDKVQCQADRFLSSVFCKKGTPVNMLTCIWVKLFHLNWDYTLLESVLASKKKKTSTSSI